MSRIAELFIRLKTESLQRDDQKARCALIDYITAGDPTPEATPGYIDAMLRGGVDLIELGVPFSDPIADGPVIQQAGERAIKAGTNLAKVLEIAREVRSRSEVPLLLFTYLNPVVKYGFEKLAHDAKAAGIDGVLLTDASVEEADIYVAPMRAAGLDTVFLAAPTSSERRLKLVAQYSSGFVYMVSRTGITGEQQTISDVARPLIARMRAQTDLPLAMGFGISTPAQVAALKDHVDAVVVGSAIVRLIERDPAQLETFIASLRAAIG